MSLSLAINIFGLENVPLVAEKCFLSPGFIEYKDSRVSFSSMKASCLLQALERNRRLATWVDERDLGGLTVP